MNKKEVLLIFIITFITIAAWAVFDIFHTRAQVQIPQELQKIIEPVDPNFDLSALEQ